MGIIALSGSTISLDHILVDSVFGAAIVIIHSDREGRRRRRSRRPAVVAIFRLVRCLLHRKITSRCEILCNRGAPGPPEASNVQGIDDGGPYADVEGAD